MRSSNEPATSLLFGWLQRERCGIGGMQSDPPVATGERAVTRPDHLARCGELVEHARRVVRDAGRQHERLPRAGRESARRRAARSPPRRHRFPRAGGRCAATRAGTGRTPRARRARRCRGSPPATASAGGAAPRHRTTRSRPTAERRTGRCGGQEEAARDAALRLEPLQGQAGDCDADAEPLGDGRTRERGVRAGEARHEIAQRVGDGLEERVRDAHGKGGPERIAQASGVLDRGHPRHAADVHVNRAAVG